MNCADLSHVAEVCMFRVFVGADRNGNHSKCDYESEPLANTHDAPHSRPLPPCEVGGFLAENIRNFSLPQQARS